MLPKEGLYLPAEQRVQAAALPVLKEPAAHIWHASELLAPREPLAVPAAHALQRVLPGSAQKPSAQHTPAPALLLVPAAQLAQKSAPPVANDPTAQGAHAVWPGRGLYVPAGQAGQLL